MMLFNDKYKIESDKLNVTISVKTNNTKKIKVDSENSLALLRSFC